MKKLFINFSNHPSNLWQEKQLSAANCYGDIIDLPFPVVNESLDTSDIDVLSVNYYKQIQEISNFQPCTVHVMGEMTLTFNIVNKLKAAGYKCVASSSIRDVVLLPDGTKHVAFHFCRFREY
jgi:hypothetical protein